MRNLLLGIVVGFTLSASLGIAGTNLYNGKGQVQAPYGSTQSYDYFRLRQSWLDLAASRKAAEEIARNGQLHPCVK